MTKKYCAKISVATFFVFILSSGPMTGLSTQANAEAVACTKNVAQICKTNNMKGAKLNLNREVYKYSHAKNAAKEMMAGGKGLCTGLGNVYSVSGAKIKQRGPATSAKAVRKACKDIGL